VTQNSIGQESLFFSFSLVLPPGLDLHLTISPSNTRREVNTAFKLSPLPPYGKRVPITSKEYENAHNRAGTTSWPGIEHTPHPKEMNYKHITPYQ
jgi:hypothetical protein